MKYPTLKRVVISSLILYFGIAAVIRMTHPVSEIYPFFEWWLFSAIPNERSMYSIQLLSYGDTVYSPPLPFNKTHEIFEEMHMVPTQYISLLQRLGEAVRSNDIRQEKILRGQLEAIFKKSARYDIVWVRYEPLEYWNHGTYKIIKVLGTFETEKHDAI